MKNLSWPDTRGWALGALFLTTWLILGLIAWKPDLSDNTMFVTLATLIVGSGGLLNSLGFYFGSSKSSSTKDDTIGTLVAKQKPPDGP